MSEYQAAKDVGIGYDNRDRILDKKEVGIGMLGRGFMCKAHTNAYKKIGYIFDANYIPRLVAVGASTVENAGFAAARYGYERAYAGWEDMLKDPDVQVIDNVTPDNLHEQPCVDAAKAGKHVLCEKPMTENSESAKRMLDAVTQAKVKHAVSFNYRFFPAVRLAWELIQKGAIGDILHFYGRYFQPYGLPLEAPMEAVWYHNMSGTTQGLASHLVDQARFLAGELATIMGDVHIYAPIRDGRKVTLDDGMRAIVEFKNGATGTLESLSVTHGRNNHLYWEIYGTRGSLIWDLENPTFLKVNLKDTAVPEVVGYTDVSVTEPGHPFMDIWWPRSHNIGWEHGHINLIAHFLDCVANDKDVAPFGATFEDGYRSEVVMDTLKAASREGKKLDIEF